jgi:hypothetical protein
MGRAEASHRGGASEGRAARRVWAAPAVIPAVAAAAAGGPMTHGKHRCGALARNTDCENSNVRLVAVAQINQSVQVRSPRRLRTRHGGKGYAVVPQGPSHQPQQAAPLAEHDSLGGRAAGGR